MLHSSEMSIRGIFAPVLISALVLLGALPQSRASDPPIAQAAAAGGVDACAAVNKQDAALVLGPNPTVQTRTQPSTTFSTCVYRPSSNSHDQLSIIVNIAALRISYRQAPGTIGDTFYTPVNGLGDSGYMAIGPRKIHLSVERGMTALLLDFSGKSDPQKQEALRRIASAALKRLP